MSTGSMETMGEDGCKVVSPEDMAGKFVVELLRLIPKWKADALAHPSELAGLERQIHQAFARGADKIVTGLMAMLMDAPSFDEVCEAARLTHEYPLKPGVMRTSMLQLLGGTVVNATALYYAPKINVDSSHDESSVERPGVSLPLAIMGCGKGCSPALEDEVAREVATRPSLESARNELERQGIPMNGKTVSRIAYQTGRKLLTLRKRRLRKWKQGRLEQGDELSGKRVCVQIDGGRMKIRGESKAKPRLALNLRTAPEATKDNPQGVRFNAQLPEDGGRAQPVTRSSYTSEWREPKQFTIFVHDEKGRKIKLSRETIEATMEGPDVLANLVAMHLHRLGASKAKSIAFVSDGAPWIWDRIDGIVEKSKIPKEVTIVRVLDNSHANHHLSRALELLGYEGTERRGLFVGYRTQLRNGEWQAVVDAIQRHLQDRGTNTNVPLVECEIRYLLKHGEGGHLNYPLYKLMGVPLGSGNIESSIRRVINLRLKGNGINWLAENAEAMLQLRCQLLSDRWDESIKAMRLTMLSDARVDWQVNDESTLAT